MDIENIICNVPQSWIILISGAIGFLIKTIIDHFTKKSEKRVELQELYWKEKIEAAKKASEYYLFQVGFFNLTADKYEIIEEDRDGAEQLVRSTEELIDNFQKRLLEFPHFEHYHINLFYDFNDAVGIEWVKENYETIQKIHAIKFDENDSNSVFSEKWNLYKQNFGILKKNNRKLIELYQGYLKTIREDIKTLPYK